MGSYSDSQARASTLYRPQVKLVNYRPPEAKPTVQPPAVDTSTLPVIGKEGHETVTLSNFSFPENREFVNHTDPWKTNRNEELLRYSQKAPQFVLSKADQTKPPRQNLLKVTFNNLQPPQASPKITPPTGRTGNDLADVAVDAIMDGEISKEEQRREKKEEGRTQKGKLESFFVNIVSSLSGGGFDQHPSFT